MRLHGGRHFCGSVNLVDLFGHLASCYTPGLLGRLPDFEDVIFDATDAIGKGFACLEIEWHRVEGFWLPKTLTHRPQSWFQLHRGYRQELRLRSNTTDEQGIQGSPLNPFGWVTHIHKAKSGYLERTALFRQLVWTYRHDDRPGRQTAL